MARSLSLVAILVLTSAGFAQDSLKIDLDPNNGPHVGAPLVVPLNVPKAWAKADEVTVDIITGRDVAERAGQLTAPSITTETIATKDGMVRRDLHLVPDVRCLSLIVHFKAKAQVTRFAWTAKKSEFEELSLTRSGTITPVLRYMNRPYDASSLEARDKSYKVFHHLYDPTGKRFVTNGGHTDTASAKLHYPHHRGIMYGFNKCTYGDGLKMQADTWHCPPPNDKKKGVPTAHVAHLKTLSAEGGPVLGRHRVQLGWYGAGDKPFAEEERELTVYALNGGTLVEFASRLKTTGGKIKLDGDPQHAGFQFRAHNDVAVATKKQTYYLHPDGTKGDMGKERNWPGDKAMVDLPWYVVSFVLDGQRYSVCYLNHPNNPKETRFSERDYGRFGGYFEREITEQTPLVVNYRLWMQPGEMTQTQANNLHAAFAALKTSVK